MKKPKIVKNHPYLHTVVYNVKINLDTKSGLSTPYFAVFLNGDGLNKVRGKYVRSWNRFFESDTPEGVKENIMRNDDWQGATFKDGKPVTSQGIVDMIDDESLKDQFYSYLYLRPEFEDEAIREVVDVILTPYNKKVLYTRAEQNRLCMEEILPTLKEKFEQEQVALIAKYLFHRVMTDSNSLKTMEVL